MTRNAVSLYCGTPIHHPSRLMSYSGAAACSNEKAISAKIWKLQNWKAYRNHGGLQLLRVIRSFPGWVTIPNHGSPAPVYHPMSHSLEHHIRSRILKSRKLPVSTFRIPSEFHASFFVPLRVCGKTKMWTTSQFRGQPRCSRTLLWPAKRVTNPICSLTLCPSRNDLHPLTLLSLSISLDMLNVVSFVLLLNRHQHNERRVPNVISLCILDMPRKKFNNYIHERGKNRHCTPCSQTGLGALASVKAAGLSKEWASCMCCGSACLPLYLACCNQTNFFLSSSVSLSKQVVHDDQYNTNSIIQIKDGWINWITFFAKHCSCWSRRTHSALGPWSSLVFSPCASLLASFCLASSIILWRASSSAAFFFASSSACLPEYTIDQVNWTIGLIKQARPVCSSTSQ